jgi:RNA polymerase sigma-70 factor (ECF subfamily)
MKPEQVESFRKVVFEYADYAYRVAYRLLANADDARDAVQETFIKLYRNFEKYDQRKSMKNWICTIEINTCRDMFRSRKRLYEAQEFNDDVMSDSGKASTWIENRIFTEELLRSLDFKYRTVITLFYLEQKSVEEISTILRRPKTLVKVWLHRARNQILKNIAQMEGVGKN